MAAAHGCDSVTRTEQMTTLRLGSSNNDPVGSHLQSCRWRLHGLIQTSAAANRLAHYTHVHALALAVHHRKSDFDVSRQRPRWRKGSQIPLGHLSAQKGIFLYLSYLVSMESILILFGLWNQRAWTGTRGRIANRHALCGGFGLGRHEHLMWHASRHAIAPACSSRTFPHDRSGRVVWSAGRIELR
jgi:hypothetical protein